MNSIHPPQTANSDAAAGRYPDRLALYHASGKGNGAAIRLEARLNRDGEQGYNCFFLEAAAQNGSPQGGRERQTAFDWEHKITVKLGFSDICELLAVLEGVQAQAGGRRNGLYHESRDAVTMIRFERREDGSYCLGLSRKVGDPSEPHRLHFVLSPVEAVGIRVLLTHGLFGLTFPQVCGSVAG